jgi:hypothetical protein
MPFCNDAGIRRRGGLVVKNESNFVGNYAWNQIRKKFSTGYLWKKTRLDYPRLIIPAKAIDNKDRRVD